jgi:hypothetical protein
VCVCILIFLDALDYPCALQFDLLVRHLRDVCGYRMRNTGLSGHFIQSPLKIGKFPKTRPVCTFFACFNPVDRRLHMDCNRETLVGFFAFRSHVPKKRWETEKARRSGN